MARKKNPQNYTAGEIAEMAQNTILFILRYAPSEVSEKRQEAYRECATGLISAMDEFATEEPISESEILFVLALATLMMAHRCAEKEY